MTEARKEIGDDISLFTPRLCDVVRVKKLAANAENRQSINRRAVSNTYVLKALPPAATYC